MLGRAMLFLATPILILNMAAGAVGGLWLALTGEWALFFLGIVLIFTAHLFLSFVMLLGMPLDAMAAALLSRNNPLGYLLGYLSLFYKNLLIVLSCFLAFGVCCAPHAFKPDFGLTPYLLWSWGMALGPWQFLASYEQDNEFTALTLFSASVLYLLLIISAFFGSRPLLVAAGLFVLVQLIVLPIINIRIAKTQGS